MECGGLGLAQWSRYLIAVIVLIEKALDDACKIKLFLNYYLEISEPIRL